MKSTFEKMGGTYTLGTDGIYYPNLVSTDEEPHYGKYGMMRKTYLKEHRPAMYSLYMLEDRLTEHLNTVDDEAQERMDILVRQMMEQQGITEELKARDQMEWVRAVNNIRNAAEEIVLKELVYILGNGKLLRELFAVWKRLYRKWVKKMVLLKQRDFFIIVSKMFYSLQGNGIDECH